MPAPVTHGNYNETYLCKPVDAVHAAQTAGRNYITVASEFLGQDLAGARKAS